jgi:PTS system D-glucosamine-specific IIC component
MNSMKDKIFGILQRVGRSFMLPIAILPVAGLLLGLGSSLTNTTTVNAYGLGAILGEGTWLHGLLVIMNEVGSAVFDNLPLIFAVGVAIGMAKKEKEVAALAALIAFFVMHVSINGMLTITGSVLEDGTVASNVLEGTIVSVCGIYSLQMGVFGGILVGLGVAALHNRFYRISLPGALSFFGGSRFIPIISTVTYMFVGILMYFVWPVIQNGIYALGSLVTGTGYLGTLLFGIIKRALIPFGLHHVFYLPFWQTAVGGTMEVGGKLVQGGQNIFFAQLADSANLTHFNADATRYFSGEFIFMIFGLPGAALAMYRTALPEKKQAAGGLLLSAALTSMLTGITEPLEFSFLFAAPILFAVQVILAGSAYMIAHMLNIAVGLTFSGGFLDLLLFGILQGNARTNWILIIPVGIVYFLLYYFIFSFLIIKLDLKTPGREPDLANTKLYTKADVLARKAPASSESSPGNTGALENYVGAKITRGLGGPNNIQDVDCCATRLRITVSDPALVSEELLKQTGARGVVKNGNGIQVIYGPHVTRIRSDLEDYLENCQNPPSVGLVSASEAEYQILSPLSGTFMELGSVEDSVFSEGMVGKGAAIEPSEGKVYAPFEGTVSMVFDTKHAVGLTSTDGIELLIHMGIDTVSLKGEYFTIHVKEGDPIHPGDLLAEFDITRIHQAGYQTVTPVVVTNTDRFPNVQAIVTEVLVHGDIFLLIK